MSPFYSSQGCHEEYDEFAPKQAMVKQGLLHCLTFTNQR